MESWDEKWALAVNIVKEQFYRSFKTHGPDWRIIRVQTVTDMIGAKLSKIQIALNRTPPNDPILSLIDIANYSIVALILLNSNNDIQPKMSADEAIDQYALFSNLAKAKASYVNQAPYSISKYIIEIQSKIDRLLEHERFDFGVGVEDQYYFIFIKSILLIQQVYF